MRDSTKKATMFVVAPENPAVMASVMAMAAIALRPSDLSGFAPPPMVTPRQVGSFRREKRHFHHAPPQVQGAREMARRRKQLGKAAPHA